MKIRKYQVGSIIYTPTPTGAATASTQATASTSSSTASNKPEKITGTIQKEIMDLMKTDGLPSDVDKLLQYASKYLDKSSHLTDMSLFGGSDDDYDIKDYIRILSRVQKAKFNKSEYDKAASNLEDEGAWGNAATDTNGKMWVQTEDGIGKVTVNEYVKNRDKYAVITNGQLMEYRARYPQFAFDSMGMLTNLQEVDGMKSISDQLRAIVKDFKQKKVEYYKFSKGSDKITDKSGRSYNMQELSDGMEMLTQGGPSGYYKITKSTNMPDMSAAVGYLWNSLDQSMKNTIKAQIAANGGEADSKDIASFLGEVLSAGLETTNAADFDSSATNYDPNGTQKKGGSAGKETLSARDTYQIAFANGEGKDTFVDLTPRASKIYETGTMHARAVGFGPMAYVKDTRITLGDHMNLPEFLQKSALASSLQLDSITFGNRLLENWELPAVMYEGGQQTYSVYLPYKEINGKITPDFDLFEKYNKYIKAVKDNPNMPDLEKRELLKELQLSGPNIDSSDLNNIKIKNTKRFLTFAAVAGKDTIELKSIENFLGKLDRDKGKLFKVPYNNALKYNSTTPQKNVKATNKKFTEATAGDFYEGNVYIPVDQYAAYRTSSNEPVTKESLTDIDRKIKANDMINAARDYAAETDPNYTDNLNIGQFKDF